MNHADPRDFETRVREVHCRLAGDRALLSGIRVLLALERRANFDPSQPRDAQGRWTNTGISAPVSADDPGAPPPGSSTAERIRVAGPFDWGAVDLRAEEGYEGAHAIRDHVGKSDAFMLARVRGETYNLFGVLVVGLTRSGSFSSIQAANSLVNATLARNSDIVNAVAIGRSSRATLTAEFGSITGSEAYRANSLREPYMRTTTAVEVVIFHDSKQLKGFRVHTAYPINK